MRTSVRIRLAVLEELLAAARSCPDLECCGLLAGHGAEVEILLPARNALASATAYEIAPTELFSLFRRMRAAGIEHLGIYHSHPRGDNVPSRRDIEQACYPDVAYFIVSPQRESPRPVRAFEIAGGGVRELTVEPF